MFLQSEPRERLLDLMNDTRLAQAVLVDSSKNMSGCKYVSRRRESADVIVVIDLILTAVVTISQYAAKLPAACFKWQSLVLHLLTVDEITVIDYRCSQNPGLSSRNMLSTGKRLTFQKQENNGETALRSLPLIYLHRQREPGKKFTNPDLKIQDVGFLYVKASLPCVYH